LRKGGEYLRDNHLAHGRGIALAILVLALVALLPLSASAKVTGECANCHTMHNSQDGAPVALSGATWEASGVLNGTADSDPNGHLLVTDCVGCHSSASSQTIVSAGSSDVPIVYNHVQPTDPLAGGNFYWVAQGDDTKGHNVYGISGQDSNISVAEGAPGQDGISCGGAGSCHSTLAAPPNPGAGPGSSGNWNRGGCQGCHVFTYHHVDNAAYRFLKGHGGGSLPADLDATNRRNISVYTDYVQGVEDSDWEQTASTTDHNWYKGSTTVYASDGYGLTVQQTITSFCSGCHYGFHGPTGIDPITPSLGMGPMGGPWVRHPVDIALPTTGEFATYANNPKTNYSVETPIGWETLPTDSSGTGAAGPVVMCLSCHRPHGSDQPDLMRFDYSTMLAGEGGSGGCFNCHTAEN
jgi:predicted CXXCH cytochrome family protein